MAAVPWQELARAKRDSLNSLIPEAWKLQSIPTAEVQRDVTGKYLHPFLTEREVEITETDAEGILEHTTTGKWAAEEVARAFAHRAALAHQLVNCLHEIFFDTAVEDAKLLDAYFAQHKKPVGVLHGLPVSLKDQFHVKGVETTMGYVGWIGTFEGKKGTGKERIFESVMVEELRKMGAVLYCKTAVPHTLMCGETLNNITGYTFNPKNRNLSSGGSSGGEGSLISMRGSPLGFGTDIGGSVRLPAGFNGLFGLRPSTGRIPYEGMSNTMDGQNSILSVVGPLSPSIGGIRLATKAILSQEPWLHDPLVSEIPWREEKYQAAIDAAKNKGNLTFGVIRHDGICQPFPPVMRAVSTVVEMLQKRGHMVIEWNPPDHEEALRIAGNVWDYDGGADVRKDFELSGEPSALQTAVGRQNTPQWNAQQIAANNVAKRHYQKKYMEYWNSTAGETGTGQPVDMVIAPLATFPAPRPARFLHYGYSIVWNVLDYTVCTLPVLNVDKNIDRVNEGFQPLSDLDRESQQDYDPEVYDGAHVCVQLVGRRLQEEKVIALAEYISAGLSGGLP